MISADEHIRKEGARTKAATKGTVAVVGESKIGGE
jgi:hypothetical protein